MRELVESTPSRGWVRAIGPLLIVAIGMLAYSNTRAVPFLLDDSARIVNNEHLRSLIPTTAMSRTNRPIVNYTFALNYAWGGLDVSGYHAANLCIHLWAGLCLYGIAHQTLRKLGGDWASHRRGLALAIASLWVVHPLQTQAVTYINQRYESMMGLMYMGTLYAFVRSLESSRPAVWQSLSVGLCALGMGCKEAMVSAPCVVLWYDVAFAGQSWRARWQARWGYYVGLVSTWGILGWVMLGFTDEYAGGGMMVVSNVTPWTYLVSQSSVLVRYLQLSLWPFGQCFWSQWPSSPSIADVWPQTLLIGLLLVLTIACMVRRPRLSFLGGWFFLILAPTSSVFPIRDLYFEHRMYLPLASVCVVMVIGTHGLLAWLPISTKSRAAMQGIGFSLIILGLTWGTYQRNLVYGNEVSIWQDTVLKSPEHAQAWNNLGLAFVTADNIPEALRGFQRAEHLAPDNGQIQANLGASLLQSGRIEDAMAHLTLAIKLLPLDYVSQMNMAHAHLDQGNAEISIPFQQRSIFLAPIEIQSQLWMELSRTYTLVGRSDDAIHSARAATRLAPRDAIALGTLGILLADRFPDEAIAQLNLACDIDSSVLEFHWILAKLLATSHAEQAIPHFVIWIQANPEDREARYRLVSAHASIGQLEQAIAQMEIVVRQQPESKSAQDYLEQLRRAMQ